MMLGTPLQLSLAVIWLMFDQSWLKLPEASEW
jgi:hypothetical protein